MSEVRRLGLVSTLAAVVVEKGYLDPRGSGGSVRRRQRAALARRGPGRAGGACLDVQADLAARGLDLSVARILGSRHGLEDEAHLSLFQGCEGRGEEDVGMTLVDLPAWADAFVARRLADQRECLALRRALQDRGVPTSLAQIYLERGYLTPGEVRELLDGEPAEPPALALLEGDPSPVVAPGSPAASEAVERRIDPDLLREGRRFRLGRIAVLECLADREAIREGLRIQVHLRELGLDWRLGRILVGRGVLGPRDLARLLAIQRSNLAPVRWAGVALDSATGEEDRQLARTLAPGAILDEEHVQECVHAQRLLDGTGAPWPAAV